MDKELLTKYLKNKCSALDLNEIIQWINDDAESPESYALVNEIIEELIPENEEAISMDENQILDKIHHTLNTNQAGLIASSNQKTTSRLVISRFLSRVAVILFLPFFIYSIYTYILKKNAITDQIAPEDILYNEIIAPFGSIVNMELPDGSKVWLNNGSKLRYPQKFAGSDRLIFLEGEGYFEVARNPEKPFIVDTKGIRIVALGTKFDVMAYENELTVETTLKEGKVLIQQKLTNGTMQELLNMKPNEHMTYDTDNKKYTVSGKNPEEFISWTAGKLILRDVPLDQVVKRLSRWYNVEFKILDNSLNQYSYTATIVDETLPQVLDLLKMATPIEYSISTRLKQADGTYTRQDVKIWEREIPFNDLP